MIYGHCDCGIDRTGQSFGAYAMRYLNFTWKEANKWNIAVAGHPIQCPNWLAMQWYCLYLRDVLKGSYAQLHCDEWYPCEKAKI